jgi:hypothetical protein
VLESMGLKRDGGAGIDYRERSPLVVPRDSSSLPSPETAPLTQRYPGWPVDPEVRYAREQEELERKRQRQQDEFGRHRVLMPSELAAGRRTGPPRGPESPTLEESARTPEPSALGYVGNVFSSMFKPNEPESKPFRGEPPRTALTEPPPGYQTPEPGQPYGIGKEKFDKPLPSREEYAFGTAR